MTEVNLLDCTFRDGGYYNDWDFPPELVQAYLAAMKAARVDIVELGFRFIKNDGFKGPCAYTTDDFVRSLAIPEGLTVAVMVNGGDLLTGLGLELALERLFPETAATTPVNLVRFACHFHEFEHVLPAAGWLAERGYKTGINLMQIADRSHDEVLHLARKAREWPVEVLYFADSMGSMSPDDAARIIGWLREEWDGPLGIHTHDNMGLALQNTLRAHAEGVTWLDGTVTGMGRGPGNARTEELVIETEDIRGRNADLVPLMALIRKHFQPMKEHYGWGSNPYYYLSGKYGIHPTFIQEMLGDARYDEEDVLAVIDRLKSEGGKKFSFNTLDGARHFYRGAPRGSWSPATLVEGREVLIIGRGMSAARHRPAIEAYIRRAQPLVLGLNTQSAIAGDLIDLRVACHPVRLLADSEAHALLPQPLITPASMLPETLQEALAGKKLLDFGLGVEAGTFAFHDTHCIAPTSLVIAYALAAAISGHAKRILLAGFDGYPPGDPRNEEMETVWQTLAKYDLDAAVVAITPTHYKNLAAQSIYGF